MCFFLFDQLCLAKKKFLTNWSRDRTGEFRQLTARGENSRGARAPNKEQIARLAALELADQTMAGAQTRLPAEQVFGVALHAVRRAQEGNDQQRLHFCLVEQMLIRRQTEWLESRVSHHPLQLRDVQLADAQTQLARVSELFARVLEMVAEHGDKLDILERNVYRAQVRIDASADQLIDAAPRTYRTRQHFFLESIGFPRSRPARFRLAFFAVVAVNILLALVFLS